ncbi:FMN-linked oxidoreductase [Meredithblackwellia eburnea MCA 4105]
MASNNSKILSRPITFELSGKTAPNRFLKSAQSEYQCDDSDDVGKRGKPTEKYAGLYREWGQNPVGLISTGNIMVHRDHREGDSNAIIDKNNPWDPIAAFRPAILAAKSHGSLVIPQLSFPGRQAGLEQTPSPLSSSDIQLQPSMGKEYGTPRAMTLDEIEDLKERFVFAAVVLWKAGADGCQIHASHGYIFTQFMAPRTNRRTDKYGGSYENRTRLLKEVITCIASEIPLSSFIISVKLNSQDFVEGGWTFEETKKLLPELEKLGVDHIDISGGVYDCPVWRGTVSGLPNVQEQGYFTHFSRLLKPLLKRAVLSTTGGFRSAEAMAQAIESGACDMIGVARPLRLEMDLVSRVLGGETWVSEELLERQQIVASQKAKL